MRMHVVLHWIRTKEGKTKQSLQCANALQACEHQQEIFTSYGMRDARGLRSDGSLRNLVPQRHDDLALLVEQQRYTIRVRVERTQSVRLADDA